MLAGQSDDSGIMFLGKKILEPFDLRKRLKDLNSHFRLWLSKCHLIYKKHLPVPQFLRKDSIKRFSPHFLRYLALKILVFSRTASNATVPPDRRATGTVPSATGALLPPRFSAATTHFTSAFGMSHWFSFREHQRIGNLLD